MRWPEFLNFTPEERRAMLAVLLFTGGGGVLIELGRRYPAWTPDFKLTESRDRAPGAADTAGADSAVAPDSGAVPFAMDDPAAGRHPPMAGSDSGFVMAGLGRSHGGRGDRARTGEAAAPTPESTGPVDLNTASAGDLTRLPGVGPKLAERIVADREANGPYRSVAELDRVKGVGPALLQKIAGMAVVGAASGAARRPG
jgi:competence ComEA-like helix-hairpin-helix protein